MPRSKAKSATIRQDGYKEYLNRGGSLSYRNYREACEMFNEMISDEIVEGKIFSPGHKLGDISVVKVQRNYEKPRINWPESHKLKKEILEQGGAPREAGSEEGEDWLVFYTDDWYCRFHWNKFSCQLQNKTVYSFHATRGAKGVKRKLQDRLAANPLHHLSFRVITHNPEQL